MLRQIEIKKTPFKIIGVLAKAKNKEMLKNLVNEGLCVGAFHGPINNIMLLAKEGDDESVYFLLKEFGANVNHALYGAALSCRMRFIKNEIGKSWLSLNYAVKGMAECGNISMIEELIDRGASLDAALRARARETNFRYN